MKKFPQFDRLPARQPHRAFQTSQESCCDFNAPCFRCSMIAVTGHRFAIFQKKFGRLPGPDDELFFDEARPQPVRACEDEIKSQIFAASEACGLNFFILLSHLGLGSRSVHCERPL